MKTMSIDIETYSDIDLAETGVYKYCTSPEFAVILFAYAFDDEPVNVIDLASGEELPEGVKSALIAPNVLKTAFNANFERVCLSRYYRINLPIEQWSCTAVTAAAAGLPGKLEQVPPALNMEELKMQEGRALIRLFSKPDTNGKRVMPHSAPDKWKIFKEYNKQDVVVEREIRRRLRFCRLPESEKRLWVLDQQINDRGVMIDRKLAEAAVEIANTDAAQLLSEAKKLTGLDNPNSAVQMKRWIYEQTGVSYPSLNKEYIPDIRAGCGSILVNRALDLRAELAKSSIKKYNKMLKCLCPDGRARGLLQFYGAGRTGRWAGRNIQIQNLSKNRMEDLDLAREYVRAGDYESLSLLFGSVSDTLSQLVRTAFIPSEGCRFIASDFSAIEARVIAWLAGEQWRLDVFSSHGRIYEASAAQMFRVPIEKIKKGNPEYALRQKGKVAELALGYQGSKGSLIAMGALKMGLQEEELMPLVNKWRASNQKICRLWSDLENAAFEAMETGHARFRRDIFFETSDRRLLIRLPSGRKLSYYDPKIINGTKFGGRQISYMGKDESGKWRRIPTYGGKITENVVQAIARDCLAEAMLRLDAVGFDTVFHVHDEAVLDVPLGQSSAREVADIMGSPIEWAPGLPLNADAFECEFYRKD